MSAKVYKQLESKYKAEIKRMYQNKWGETFITVKDLEDNSEFEIDIRYGENIEKSFSRIFGDR